MSSALPSMRCKGQRASYIQMSGLPRCQPIPGRSKVWPRWRRSFPPPQDRTGAAPSRCPCNRATYGCRPETHRATPHAQPDAPRILDIQYAGGVPTRTGTASPACGTQIRSTPTLASSEHDSAQPKPGDTCRGCTSHADAVRWLPDAIEALDVRALLQEWDQAGKSMWPKSWLVQRRIRGQVVSTQSTPAPTTIAEDLQRWIAIRELRARLNAIDPGPSSSAIWKGHNTDPALLAVVMRLQASLAACVEGRAWSDDGFDLISQGQAGLALKETLERMRDVRALEGEISSLNPLTLRQDRFGPVCRPNPKHSTLRWHSNVQDGLSSRKDAWRTSMSSSLAAPVESRSRVS